MKKNSQRRQLGPRPSIPDPRRHLLSAVLTFVRAARSSPGVLRIALLGSLATEKPVPKDADVLVTIDATMDLASLAHLGRRLKGAAQTINLGADNFLADRANCYLGRICHYRECHARAACQALHCGQQQHLNDDLQIVTQCSPLISAPPFELWPRIVSRCAVPVDTDALLVAELEKDGTSVEKGLGMALVVRARKGFLDLALVRNGGGACKWQRRGDRRKTGPATAIKAKLRRRVDATSGRRAVKRPTSKCNSRRMIMKIIMSAFFALSVLAGIATPASADRPFGSSNQGPPQHYGGGY